MMIKTVIKIAVFLVFIDAGSAIAQEKTFEMERNSMVSEQIEARGITHIPTLEAMRKVPRHLFVPQSLWSKAYFDSPLPIGNSQTISQPYIVAFMTSLIAPERGDKVLEIGTGSGYQAAILSAIVDSVFTVEIIEDLAKEASDKFESLGLKNIWVKTGDGYFGWEAHAPFDKIIVTAAANEIPPILIEQLAEGGKMIIPIGPEFSTQYLVLIRKKNGKISRQNVLPVRFVPFTRDD